MLYTLRTVTDENGVKGKIGRNYTLYYLTTDWGMLRRARCIQIFL